MRSARDLGLICTFYKLIRQHSTTPIAIGEVFNSIWDCNKLIENEVIDFIRVAATYGGGITHLKRIVDLAGLHHVRTGFHGAPSHSPISMAAQHHLNAWAPNFGIQEYLVLGTPECDALFPSAHKMERRATATAPEATRLCAWKMELSGIIEL